MWLFGNNPAGAPVYDVKNGRGYDGIGFEKQINLNSVAESTIEALSTLLEIEGFLLVLVLDLADGKTLILENPLAQTFFRPKQNSGLQIDANYWFQKS